ncbi:hypothetical protein ASPZODRAFT_13465 [Penicilliopsis zonata CBS 506.65]|uniref:Uncharacterized protein n=1 Tax=Penicilliopsis zonata CBS 506.65 TaxID=1073090 RepID=A0A1L9ST53_9EURO|nr:hypothetical protein ASPZODRAFT_13465 [Penicilliopsis zonata CBS 506.65]OJJ50382.1 hypothetical protein ASPZODRAFT_13465 [Penicilliopsis zonata CBS 506.65]
MLLFPFAALLAALAAVLIFCKKYFAWKFPKFPGWPTILGSGERQGDFHHNWLNRNRIVLPLHSPSGNSHHGSEQSPAAPSSFLSCLRAKLYTPGASRWHKTRDLFKSVRNRGN